MNSKKPDQSVVRTGDAADAVAKSANQVHASFARLLGRHLSAESNPDLVVAYSGGLDSHVLLLTAAQWVRQNHSASLRAIYIDHGLQAVSADWAEHCGSVCEEAGVVFSSFKAQVASGNNQSPEEAAREARYTILRQNLQTDEYLLTAHHADDQAETLMLQLMRGAGVRGLAAMPELRPIGEGFHLRPFLDITRATLLSLAQHWKLHWVEDPTNRENRYNRNLLRNTIMPSLQERWPATAVNLSRSARHCAEAAELNRQLALIDLGPGAGHSILSVEQINTLSLVRRKNALRHWIDQQGFRPPSTAQLERIDKDVVLAAPETSGSVSFGRAQIRRYRACLFLAERKFFIETAAFSYVWKDRQSALLITETGDTLTAEQVDLPWLAKDQSLTVRSRLGGERIRLIGHTQSHSVKSLLQQKGIPPWQRSRIPFLFVEDQLVGVVGIGFSGPPGGDI